MNKIEEITEKLGKKNNHRYFHYGSVQFSSVTQSCLTLCNPMNCSTPGLPVHHKLTSIKLVMPSSHLILCRPLVLLPPIPPSIRVFSNESTLRITLWHCCPSRFSFSLCPHVLISTFAAWMKSHSLLTLLTAPLLPSWGQKNKTHHMISVPLNYGNLFCGQRLVYLEMFGVHSRRMYMLPLLTMHMLP